MDMESLDAKVAIVTGGAAGIGRGGVERFVAEGARVVIADVDEQRGGSLAESLGERARFVPCDVTQEQDMSNAVAVAVEEFGGLDIMYHNAAVTAPTPPIEEISVESWDASAAALVRASFLAVKVAIAPMRERGGGSIILTSSVSVLNTLGTFPATYVTHKTAVLGLARIAALQLAPDMIRVNCLIPGAVASGMHFKRHGDSISDLEAATELLRRRVFDRFQPLPRAGEASDLAGAALFLASDDSAWVTGIELPVDGGLQHHRPLTTEEVRNGTAQVARELNPG
jgi:NAD(P)-dependent dehydrogenase (short-subunit alcohol dehydrogenase family)